MIDIHCHILPGVDDGPQTMAESLAMARKAASDGITRIVATPHVDGRFPAIMDDLPVQGVCFSAVVAAINWQLQIEKVPLTIFPGAEISSATATGDLSGLGLNNTRYVLIEWPHTHLPANAPELVFQLVAAGYWPIMAHPERNPSVIDNPGRLMDLRRLGALAQITAASLVSRGDPDIRCCAMYLLKKGAVDFIASDAHSATRRPPQLSAARSAAAARIGNARAADLCVAHPMALLEGAAIHGAR